MAVPHMPSSWGQDSAPVVPRTAERAVTRVAAVIGLATGLLSAPLDGAAETMPRLAGQPGWVCTQRIRAVPDIGGFRSQEGPRAMVRWICTQWTFLPAQAPGMSARWGARRR